MKLKRLHDEQLLFNHSCFFIAIIDISIVIFLSVADGSLEEIEQPLRRLFADQELVKSSGLMSLNSVNFSRLLIQLAHFVYAYLELSDFEQVKADGDLPELEVVVPTGGAGNIVGEFITASKELYEMIAPSTGVEGVLCLGGSAGQPISSNISAHPALRVTLPSIQRHDLLGKLVQFTSTFTSKQRTLVSSTDILCRILWYSSVERGGILMPVILAVSTLPGFCCS